MKFLRMLYFPTSRKYCTISLTTITNTMAVNIICIVRNIFSSPLF